MLLALIPAALVMLQPDLGSALVYIVIGLATLFVAGAPWRHFAALGALAAVAVALALVVLPAAGVNVLHGYQKDRLTAFLHPSDTANKEGYQQNQSRIAIGVRGEDRPRRRRDADEARLPPGAPHRFRVRRGRRAVGLRGRRIRPLAVRPAGRGHRSVQRGRPPRASATSVGSRQPRACDQQLRVAVRERERAGRQLARHCVRGQKSGRRVHPIDARANGAARPRACSHYVRKRVARPEWPGARRQVEAGPAARRGLATMRLAIAAATRRERVV